MKCSINIKLLSFAQTVDSVIAFISFCVPTRACKFRHIVLRLFFVALFPILKRTELHYKQRILSWFFIQSMNQKIFKFV
jgi:hypothetical protein